MRIPQTTILLVVMLFLLAACGAPSTVAPAESVAESVAEAPATEMAEDGEAMAEEETDEAMTEEVMMEEAVADTDSAAADMVEEDGAAMEDATAEVMEEATEEKTEDAMTAATVERPAWQQIQLTNARTGEPFTLADYAGKTVFVEPFATWCSNCRRQLGNVTQAQAQLGENVVFVALSVEANIGDDVLARYADNEGFDLIFAAMPPEMLQELAAIFGQTVSNPPATPHFIIRGDGSVTDLVTGIESADAIVSQILAEQG
jgi:thiol-disulfide isomerase/thioredoxin